MRVCWLAQAKCKANWAFAYLLEGLVDFIWSGQPTPQKSSWDLRIFGPAHSGDPITKILPSTTHPFLLSQSPLILLSNEPYWFDWEKLGATQVFSYSLPDGETPTHHLIPYVWLGAEALEIPTSPNPLLKTIPILVAGSFSTIDRRSYNPDLLFAFLIRSNTHGVFLSNFYYDVKWRQLQVSPGPYFDYLSRSVIQIVPKGHHVVSYRTFEAWTRGAQTVYVGEDRWPPKNFDPATISFVNATTSFLSYSDTLDYPLLFSQMQSRFDVGYAIWEAHLSPWAYYAALQAKTKALLNLDLPNPLPGRLENLKRWCKMGSLVEVRLALEPFRQSA